MRHPELQEKWQDRSLDRYSQELIPWSQFLYLLISWKALKSFMGMIVPHYQRKFHDTSRHFLQKNMYLTACCCSVTKLCLALCDLRTAACQTSLSFTISQSLCKLMSIESGMPFNHLILCYPLLFCPQSFLASGSFPMSWLFTSGGQSIGASASVLPMNS